MPCALDNKSHVELEWDCNRRTVGMRFKWGLCYVLKQAFGVWRCLRRGWRSQSMSVWRWDFNGQWCTGILLQLDHSNNRTVQHELTADSSNKCLIDWCGFNQSHLLAWVLPSADCQRNQIHSKLYDSSVDAPAYIQCIYAHYTLISESRMMICPSSLSLSRLISSRLAWLRAEISSLGMAATFGACRTSGKLAPTSLLSTLAGSVLYRGKATACCWSLPKADVCGPTAEAEFTVGVASLTSRFRTPFSITNVSLEAPGWIVDPCPYPFNLEAGESQSFTGFRMIVGRVRRLCSGWLELEGPGNCWTSSLRVGSWFRGNCTCLVWRKDEEDLTGIWSWRAGNRCW